MTNDVLNVSLSAIQNYRQCQQKYYYGSVERLRRKDKAIPLLLGTLIHDYLEQYYQAIKRSAKRPRSKHVSAQMFVSTKHGPSLKRMAARARTAGANDLAHEYSGMLSLAGHITDRYFETRGESDAEEYEILLVEEWLNLPLLKGVMSNGKLDMVTRHRRTKRVHLWEHKTSSNIPSNDYRLRDLQTTLYNHKLTELGLIKQPIDAVLWNYFYTKEPTVPEVLKSGGLTTRANLDSTWEVFAGEINRLRLDANDYQEQRQRLEGREETHYFPRYEQILLADPDILLGDYLQTVREIRRSRRAWQEGTRKPVRNLSLGCDWCEFARLCNAALLSGSDIDARSDFTIEKEIR